MVDVELVFLHETDVFLQDAHQRPQLTLQGNPVRSLINITSCFHRVIDETMKIS